MIVTRLAYFARCQVTARTMKQRRIILAESLNVQKYIKLSCSRLSYQDQVVEPKIKATFDSSMELFHSRAKLYPFVLPPSSEGHEEGELLLHRDVYNFRKSQMFNDHRTYLLKKSIEFLREMSHDIDSTKDKLKFAYNWLLILREHKSGEVMKFLHMTVDQLLTDGHIIEAMSVYEFVFAVFLAGEIRRFPPDRNQKRGVPDYLEEVILCLSARMSTDELGIVAHSLYKCKLNLRPENVRLKNEFFRRLVTLEGKPDHLSTNAITSLSKVLRTRSSSDFAKVHKVVHQFTLLIAHLPLETKVRLFSLVANRCTFAPKTNEFVDSFVHSMESRWKQCRLKDLERVAFGLMWTNYANQDTYKKILDAVEEVDKSDPRSGRSFLFLNGFLAMAGHYKPSYLKKIFEAANETLNHADLMSSGMAVLCSLFDEISSRDKERELKRDRKHSEILVRNSLVEIAKLDCTLDINLPDYNGPRLKPEIRTNLLDLIFVSDKNSIINQLLKIAETDLNSCLNSSNVFRSRLLPYSISEDLFFVMDKDTRAVVEPPTDFRKKLRRTSMTLRPDTRWQWYVLSIPKKTMFDPNMKLYGGEAFKKKQLEKLGYQVMVVPTLTYEKIVGTSQGTTLIRDLLVRELSLCGENDNELKDR